jgi:hypothetical protein
MKHGEVIRESTSAKKGLKTYPMLSSRAFCIMRLAMPFITEHRNSTPFDTQSNYRKLGAFVDWT